MTTCYSIGALVLLLPALSSPPKDAKKQLEVQCIQYQLIYESAKTKKGCDVVLQDDYLDDLKGNKLTSKDLRDILSEAFVNNGKRESVLYVTVKDAKKTHLGSVAKVLKNIKSQRSSKLPTYVYFILPQDPKEKDPDFRNFQVEFLYDAQSIKAGVGIALFTSTLVDLSGKRMDKNGLQRILRIKTDNEGVKEAVIRIGSEDYEAIKFGSVAKVIREIYVQRDPKIPTYIFFYVD